MAQGNSMLAIAIATVFLVMHATAGWAAETEEEFWREHNAGSFRTLQHAGLNQWLEKAVMEPDDYAKYQGARKYRRKTGSNMIGSSSRPPDDAVNAIPYEILPQSYQDMLEGYIGALSKIDISDFNRNEQLAYWLNLRNAMVLKGIVEEYPLRSLKKEARDGGGFWAEETVMVRGRKLSISDIERIVLEGWESPLVVYGFFNGTLEGPEIQKTAFSGADVMAQLERIARQYVDLNRGISVRGSSVRLGGFFKKYAGKFGNETSLLKHLQDMSHGDRHADLMAASRITYNHRTTWALNDLQRVLKGGWHDFEDMMQTMGVMTFSSVDNTTATAAGQ